MVALVVICVGLLGVAKMQALSLANTTISRQRSIAAIEAASLAAAMRANRLYWGTTASNFAATWNPTNAPAFVVQGDANLAAAATAGNAHACDGAAGAVPRVRVRCQQQALAAADLAGWTTALSAVLPNPSATITCGVPIGTTLPASCMINITWSETSVAMNDPGSRAGGRHEGRRHAGSVRAAHLPAVRGTMSSSSHAAPRHSRARACAASRSSS